MAILRSAVRWLGRTAFALVALVVVYGLYAAVAYRDIPTDTLISRYGGENLHFAQIEGNRVAYRHDGRPLGEAPALLLIHSHYFNSRMWDGWLPYLEDAFSIVRFDLTSHGLTGPDTSNDYSMERDLRLLDGLIDALGVYRVSLVGSSLGGNIAFHYAAKHSDKVEKLVLINSGGLKREQSSKRNAQAIPDWFYRVFYFVPQAAYRAFIEWMVFDASIVSDALVDEFHAMFRHAGNRQAELERMRTFDVGEPAPVLAAITAPTLILWGAQNPQLPTSHLTRFEKALSASLTVRSRLIPEAGHLLPVEKPEVSAMATREFLLTEYPR